MLSGIYPPLATPFNADGSLALGQLQSNVEKLNTTGVSGYVALGSNSEAAHVTPDEASKIFETVSRAATPEKVVIAGTGQLSTQATIEMNQRAADAGCKAALVITPFYYKSNMTGETLCKHFEKVANRSPIPVLIYNVPGNAGINIASSFVAEIAQHPNVIGIKDSLGDVNQLAETIRLTSTKNQLPSVRSPSDAGFCVISGNFGATLPSLTLGVRAGILAVANVAPKECVFILDLFHQGEIERAKALHLRLLPLAQAVTSGYGVPGLKAAMDEVGYFGGVPRMPLQPLSEAHRAKLREVLHAAQLTT